MASPVHDSPYVPDDPPKRQIRVEIPERFYMLPGAAVIFGVTIGLFRGSRRASLRFLAENVHRPPTTMKGWYFYNKTKNYRMIMAGLKEAGADALKLGTSAAGWVCIEEGMRRLGEDFEPFKEVAAGVGTAGIFSLACESCGTPPFWQGRWCWTTAMLKSIVQTVCRQTWQLGPCS